MTTLKFVPYTMPAATLGPDNPLPPLTVAPDLHEINTAPGVPEDMRHNLTYGRVATPLPYTMQDNYGRVRTPRAFNAAVLENDVLRATFMPEVGGRLWSLVHKPSGRELFAANPVFQPANLAIRNAWFCGGVEWNIGLIGHCPFTCSPLFTARVIAPDGTQVLRMYEYERIRRVPFQIDAYLPDGSPVLYVRVRIVNPHDEPVPMYWWSNIAATEAQGTRVLVPAASAYHFDYKNKELGLQPFPVRDGVDISYPTNIGNSTDYFFHVDEPGRPYVAALDAQGRGLVQTSTATLKGRKLFVWGNKPGGRSWQTFLATEGYAYLEIQAGLARTQMEHVPMPERTEWSWLEAYGMIEADAKCVHGKDWSAACAEVRQRLDTLVPAATFASEDARSAAWADVPPTEIVQRGAGWGALERARRSTVGERQFCPPGMVFDDASLGPAQAPWIELLRTGAFPEQADDMAPSGYVESAVWRPLLGRALEGPSKDNWAAWLHMGVLHYQDGRRDDARKAWARSNACRVTPWALRNLAVLAAQDGDTHEAAVLLLDACRMQPSLVSIAVECGRALIADGRSRVWLNLLRNLPDEVTATGRVHLLEVRALMAEGELDAVEELLMGGAMVVEDLREGETALSDIWYQLHEQRLSQASSVPVDDALRARVKKEFPLPPHLDFRQSS